VTRTGQPVVLRPMNSKERWVVHNVVNETSGLRSESEGEGRMRRVKIEPE
jgi:spoIIIJ-associated protein